MSVAQRTGKGYGFVPRAGALAVVVAGLVLSGCGYSTSSLLREDIRTVYVPVFENRTWRRGLEVELTRALVRELTLHTHLHIAPKEEADSTLDGEILDFEQDIVTKTANDQVLLKSARAKVRFHWVDNLTGREITPSQLVVEQQTFAVARADPLESWLFRELAQRIVGRMERDW